MAESNTPTRHYSFLYKTLVTSNKDVLGLLAYALYKSAKMQYIEDYKKDHNGANPPEEDLDRFVKFEESDSQIELLKTSAEKLVQDYNKELVSTEIEYAIDASLKEHSSWKKTLGLSFLGSFLYALVVAIVYFAMYLKDPAKAVDIFKAITNYFLT